MATLKFLEYFNLQWHFWKPSLPLVLLFHLLMFLFNFAFPASSSFSIILKQWDFSWFPTRPSFLFVLCVPHKQFTHTVCMLFCSASCYPIRQQIHLGKRLKSQVHWERGPLEGCQSSLPSQTLWQMAGQPQLEQLRKGNTFLTEEIHFSFE